MKFGGFKGQIISYPKQLLHMTKIQYGGYNPRWRLTTIEMLKNLSSNDTTMKFCGFKGQMMLYPKQLLHMTKIQYGGYNRNALKIFLCLFLVHFMSNPASRFG